MASLLRYLTSLYTLSPWLAISLRGFATELHCFGDRDGDGDGDDDRNGAGAAKTEIERERKRERERGRERERECEGGVALIH